MKMDNEIEFNEDYVVDIEFLYFEKLIEEREIYEEEFFSLEPSTEELDYIISEYDQEIEKQEINAFYEFAFDFNNPFEYEDSLNELRDKKLIEEREQYESTDRLVLDEFALNDIFDFQIKDLEEMEFIERNGYDYDFKYEPEDYGDYEYDQYEEDMFWNLHYLRESQFATQNTCECGYLDYMPNDDGLCDYLDCYDYPEGPNENLCGIKYY